MMGGVCDEGEWLEDYNMVVAAMRVVWEELWVVGGMGGC